MLPLFNAVLVDVVICLGCFAALATFARLSMSHPATTYLIFHAAFVSARAIAILNGARTLFWWRGAVPVTHDEVSRAMAVADLALVVMTCAWITVAHQTSKTADERARSIAQPLRRGAGCAFLDFDDERARSIAQPLRLAVIQAVAAIAVPLGCLAMVLWSNLPGFAPRDVLASWTTSSWVVIAQTWAGLGLLALIYWYGFRASLVIPMAAYLGLMIYQGHYRFRLLISAILLVQVYVDRRGRRWPTLSGAAMLIACGLIFFPLKEIGQTLQAGGSLDSTWSTAKQGISDALHWDHPDEMILDEFASTLTLADRHDFYWGSTYLGLFTVAIPRQLWPNKPGLTEYEKEISTAARPMAQDGMAITMLGEFYLNFSYAGVVFISFLFAYFSGRWFQQAYQNGYYTLNRFLYLLFACNLIQIYRDGLISLFVFMLINMMPLSVIALIHFFVRPSGQLRQPILTVPLVRGGQERQSNA